MSHVHRFFDETRRETIAATPNPRNIGKSIQDFYTPTVPIATRHYVTALATPSTRKMLFHADLEVGIEDEEHKESMRDLVDRTWQVYSAGPLFNCEDSDEFNEKVAKRINLDLNIRPNPDRKVEVKTIKGLRGHSYDSQAIRVIVSVGKKVEMRGYFISIEAMESELVTPVNILPVCLASGESDIVKSVFGSLEKIFDTIISPHSFSQDDMLWMTAMWATQKVDEESLSQVSKRFKVSEKKFRMQLMMPKTIQESGISSIDLSIDIDVVTDIWKKVHIEMEAVFSLEERDAFHDAVKRHLLSTVGIDISKFHIRKFSLPIIALSESGKIHIYSHGSVKSVLKFITSTCQDLTSAQPKLATEIQSFWE